MRNPQRPSHHYVRAKRQSRVVNQAQAQHVAHEGLQRSVQLVWVVRGRYYFDEKVVRNVVLGQHSLRELVRQVVRRLRRKLVVALLLVTGELAKPEKALLPALHTGRSQLSREEDLRQFVYRIFHVSEHVRQRNGRLRPVYRRGWPHILV